jgi:hypothetical protein
MLHVLTVHWRSPRWIDIQLDFLARHIHEPYRTYASIEGIDERVAEGFDVIVPQWGLHAGKLNHLATVAGADADDEDLLMFLDGDAFPIADPMPAVRRGLESAALVAVRRDENLGDRQPHPCFAVTTVGTWKRLPGDWSSGHAWTTETGQLISDVGGNLLYLLETKGMPWTPLLRSNTRNLHPVFFAVYGNIVYHHGGGFRRSTERVDRAMNPHARSHGLVRTYWRRRRLNRNARVSDWVFRRIRQDPHFYREVCGVNV